MREVLDFQPRLAADLPETYAILKSARLTVHARVSQIVLHGSRGLARGYRLGSDIDLSLVADVPADANPDILREIYETTVEHWKADIDLDLAVVFDKNRCGLTCFGQNTWKPGLCSLGGRDCFGLYKIGKGFNGLVPNAGVEVERMYPCLKIWARS